MDHTDKYVKGYYDVPRNDTTAMKEALAMQPVKFSVDASTWKQYESGIVNDTECLVGTNHAVTAVGWGTAENGSEFWIIKNSWGTDFGENGYIRVANNQAADYGICGVNKSPSYPITGVRNSVGTPVCSANEYCCPEAKACLLPVTPRTSCVDDESVCGTGHVCCPVTKICVNPGIACTPPPVCGDDAYCAEDIGACLTPTNKGVLCDPEDGSSCPTPSICNIETNLCVNIGHKCDVPVWEAAFYGK